MAELTAPIITGNKCSNIVNCLYVYILPELTKTPAPEKQKGFVDKMKELATDKEEQLEIVSTFVRLGIVCWSGFILTLAYVDLPGFQKQNFDPTFIASVFTGALSTFGLATAKDKKPNGVTKEDIEKMISKSNETADHIIRVKTPLTILGAEEIEPKA